MVFAGNQFGKRVATWLELAVAGRLGGTGVVRLHPLAGDPRHNCAALSLDGRLVHDSAGRLTIFRGSGTVIRFLTLLGWSEVAHGDPVPVSVVEGAHYLCLRRGGRLRACTDRNGRETRP